MVSQMSDAPDPGGRAGREALGTGLHLAVRIRDERSIQGVTRWRVVVAGLNHYHATGWVESLAALGDRVDVVARYDPDPRRAAMPGPDHTDPALAASFPAWLANVPFDSDLDRLLAEHRPDVALIALPNALAPDAIVTCARRGVHALVDKPGARTAAEMDRAVAATRASGTKTAIGFARRYQPGWRDVADLVAAGRLGRLLATEATFAASSVAVRDPANAIFDRDAMGGGVLHWLGIHDIDALLWLTGERIVEAQAMTATLGDPSIAVEDVAVAAIRFESGAIGMLHAAYALPAEPSEGHVALRGTRGAVTVPLDGGWRWTGGDGEPVPARGPMPGAAPQPGYTGGVLMLDDLFRAIMGNREPAATIANGAEALRVIDAIYASAASGRRVPVARPSGR